MIYLEENESIGESVKLRLHLPDGQIILYQVPALRYWTLNAEELVRRQLYALLPLQVFGVRKQLQALDRSEQLTSEEKGRLMGKEFERLKETIRQTLEELSELHDGGDWTQGIWSACCRRCTA